MTAKIARKRHYLLCRPHHFAVEYAINPWMDASADVDTARAVSQWETLVGTLRRLGHTVDTLDPEPGLPDMVYAANGAFSVDGVVYGARFRYPQRQAEAAAHEKWYRATGWRFAPPTETNEGEGDFAYVPGPGLVLAGYGYRTDPRGHAEAAEALSRPVISLKLVDDRFYHLDTALTVLDDETIAYYPGAFSTGSQTILRRLFPGALLADEADAVAFGLNSVSDDHHVVLNSEAAGMAEKLAARGYTPVPVDLSELKRGGGSVKCCIAELRAAA
ncbi:N-dimethylarginine dimethylaminohydrolase [Stackebrandtia albiflava]|uniref:N-dimethylarginine dimethylaminohydrolase n=1 Tax=Stackebrandtia albiflava TaxID=406432 RepID=A0A562V1K9_9ACTN|nr:dimethylargininase [Stackebrandtia albiflava]TWJ11810.1 N-dimethylarginine dimethylaminohydrolase [Stackebrandtia albiflava]